MLSSGPFRSTDLIVGDALGTREQKKTARIRYRRYRIRYRTGTREVSTIKSNKFLKNLYRNLDNQRNQGIYVIQIFNAAGSRYFEMPRSYAKRKNDALEAERQ